MWILSCTGDLLDGKRAWLRPGSIHLLGRTSGRGDGEHIRFIDHKSVSRKHLLIRVDPVAESDATKLHVRTGIELVDGSKSGTFINGEKIKQATKRLEDKSCTIKLGSYEQQFVLEWHPVVIANSALGKTAKKTIELKRLAGLDVKMMQAYVINETTHLIAKKRNTPTVIQALLNARWVVMDKWLDALAKSASGQSGTGSVEPSRSLLEEDFDAHWPKEDQFTVPVGAEPVRREDHYMAPRAERADVFQGMTFVFLSQNQYDTLLPVISGGGGKALLQPVKPQSTTVPELLQYVKSIEHKASHEDPRHDRRSKTQNIVVVRLSDVDDPWVTQFLSDVDRGLKQRSVEQNEFLDAVLCNDASNLRQVLDPTPHDALEPRTRRDHPTRDSDGTRPSRGQEHTLERVADIVQHSGPDRIPESYNSPAIEDTSSQPVHEKSNQSIQSNSSVAATRKRTRHIVTQSRFKGFDDFDVSDFTRPASISPEPQDKTEENEAESDAPGGDQSTSRSPRRTEPHEHATRGKKRDAEILLDADEVEQEYDSLLQGQAAHKRRRLDLGEHASPTRSTSVGHNGNQPSKKVAAPLKGVDVVAQLQAHRVKEEEDRLREEESLRQQLDGVNVEELRDLAIVEEMEIPERQPPPGRRAGTAERDERWDPKWNGRKNFKRFRRQGQSGDVPRLPRVMVALEEVPRRGHGFGDEYWLQSTAETSVSQKSVGLSTNTPASNSNHNSNRSARTASSAHEHSLDNQSGESDLAAFQRRVKQSRQQDATTNEDQRLYPEELAGRPRDEALESALESALLSGTTPTTMAGDSQFKTSGKRPAAQQTGGPAKRLRETRTTTHAAFLGLDDEDEDDALKFRRRRR